MEILKIFCRNKMPCAFSALVTAALKLFTNRDSGGNRKSFKISSVISMAYLVQSLINPVQHSQMERKEYMLTSEGEIM